VPDGLAGLSHRIDSRDESGKANRGHGPATKRWAAEPNLKLKLPVEKRWINNWKLPELKMGQRFCFG
jgi:hypothetical protein